MDDVFGVVLDVEVTTGVNGGEQLLALDFSCGAAAAKALRL